VAFASLKIPAAALNQYSGFKSVECRTVVRLQETPSLPGASDFHMCHTGFIICRGLFYFPILGVDQMSMQKPWVRKLLQAESHVGFHVK
jgi:hypothetical protein